MVQKLIIRLVWWISGIFGFWENKLTRINEDNSNPLEIFRDYEGIFKSLPFLNLSDPLIQNVLCYRISYTIIRVCRVRNNKEKYEYPATTDIVSLENYVRSIIAEDNMRVKNALPFGISTWNLELDKENRRRLELLNIVINQD